MENLIINRTHVSYGNEEYDFLNSLCDYEVSLTNPFSKVFNNYEDFAPFVIEKLYMKLHVSNDFVNELIGKYTNEFFLEHSLVMIFSDERSGANKLSLTSLKVNEDKDIIIDITRDRGLSMDMAYLFMFVEMEKGEYRKVIPTITNSEKEASFF